MLARSSRSLLAFTRRDAVRLTVVLLIASLAAILSIDFFPAPVRPEQPTWPGSWAGCSVLAGGGPAAGVGLALPADPVASQQRAVPAGPGAAGDRSAACGSPPTARCCCPAPTAAAALLLAVLLDNGVALVMTALLGVLAASITGVVEMGAYTVLGGIVGLIVVRRGERLGQFIQAALAISVVNVTVVVTFTLLGTRDVTALLQLIGASLFARAWWGRSLRRARSRCWATCSGSPPRSSCWSWPIPRSRCSGDCCSRHPARTTPLMVGNLAERAAGGDRRRPAAGPGCCVLPRGQAGQPGRVHREPGRPGEPPRRAGAPAVGGDPRSPRGERDRPRLPLLPKPLISFIPSTTARG